MKVVPLSKAIDKAHSWNGSTARFVEEVLGLKLFPCQKLMLDAMDIRDRFDQRFRPKTYRHRLMAGQRGLRSNLLICDDLYPEDKKDETK
jgi:hypothetical protein